MPIQPNIPCYLSLQKAIIISVPSKFVRSIVNLRQICVMDIKFLCFNKGMRLNQMEGVNVHRGVRNPFFGTARHYDSIAYASKNTPFFIKRSAFCDIYGV